MKWQYEIGSVRWRRHTYDKDVRLMTPPKGWRREAMIIDWHPITNETLPHAQWWLKDEYIGEDE